MPLKTERSTVETSIEYRCAFCDRRFHYHDSCAEHEWEAHHCAKTSRHEESPWGNDITFRHFPDRETFDGFAAAKCAREPPWEGVGWYKESTYRDSCRGCDMGETMWLEKVSDAECASWIDDGMQQRAADLRILFGLPLDCPLRFERDGIKWRLHVLSLPDDSISINYASPDAEPTHASESVEEAWKVWRANR